VLACPYALYKTIKRGKIRHRISHMYEYRPPGHLKSDRDISVEIAFSMLFQIVAQTAVTALSKASTPLQFRDLCKKTRICIVAMGARPTLSDQQSHRNLYSFEISEKLKWPVDFPSCHSRYCSPRQHQKEMGQRRGGPSSEKNETVRVHTLHRGQKYIVPRRLKSRG
jgi:hypothetical protein